MKYYQCELQNQDTGVTTIAWIEARGAKVGASVELPALEGQCFKVLNVYRPGIEADELREKQRMNRYACGSILS